MNAAKCDIVSRYLYLSVICAVGCKRSFCALKPFKIGYIGVPTNIPFFLRNLCGQAFLMFFFHKLDDSQMSLCLHVVLEVV